MKLEISSLNDFDKHYLVLRKPSCLQNLKNCLEEIPRRNENKYENEIRTEKLHITNIKQPLLLNTIYYTAICFEYLKLI